MRIRNANGLFRKLQGRHSLLASYRRKLLEELFQRVASLQIIEEVVQGNTGADEYELAAHDLGIAVDDLIFGMHAPILYAL